MDAPPVQYVTTADGWDIAYAVSGVGQAVVFMPGHCDHVQLAWRYPGLSDWLERLRRHFFLVQFDPRGAGMSRRGLPDDTNETDYVRDIEAVVERLHLEDILFVTCGSGPKRAARFAIEYPSKVAGIVIASTNATRDGLRSASFWTNLPAEDWDLFLYSTVPHDQTPEQGHEHVAMVKQAYTQADFVVRMKSQFEGGELRELLPNLRTPVLVLHARDYALQKVEGSMETARLSGGRMQLIDGNTAFGDADQGVNAILDFIRSLPSQTAATKTQQTDGLSSREIEVLRLIAAGKSNQQIADELVISRFTVQRHVGHIFAKTGLANRTEAAIYARDNGFA